MTNPCEWHKTLFRWCLDTRVSVYARFVFSSFFFFLGFHAFQGMRLLFMHCFMNSNRKCWLSTVNSATVHYLWTHKFHFSATFSLKMGPTALFTHLKIILLQCFQFSVFNFSKISSIQTDPYSWYFTSFLLNFFFFLMFGVKWKILINKN